MNPTLVVGMGNPILRDDAVGIRLAYLLGAGLFAAGALALRPVDPRRREDAAPS